MLPCQSLLSWRESDLQSFYLLRRQQTPHLVIRGASCSASPTRRKRRRITRRRNVTHRAERKAAQGEGAGRGLF